MTPKELSQYYALSREVYLDQERIRELENIAYAPPASQLSDMPRPPHKNESKTEQYGTELAELRTLYKARLKRHRAEIIRLERWIDEIPDSFTRQCFQLHYCKGLTWKQVAEYLGPGNSPFRVSKVCQRYMKNEGKRTERQLREAEYRVQEWEQMNKPVQ